MTKSNLDLVLEVGTLLVLICVLGYAPVSSTTAGINPSAAMMNSTVPSVPFDYSVVVGIVPALATIVSALFWLYRRLRDRHWKDKYDRVVVARES